MDYSELFVAIMDWAISKGAEKLNTKQGLWEADTAKLDGIGPIHVAINGHKDTIENVPPYAAMLTMPEYFPGIIGIITPVGGTLVSSSTDGEDENGLIRHFKRQTVQ